MPVLGEWGVDDHDSVYYLSGWMLSGFILVGDIRDIAASIWNKDGLGVLLNTDFRQPFMFHLKIHHFQVVS